MLRIEHFLVGIRTRLFWLPLTLLAFTHHLFSRIAYSRVYTLPIYSDTISFPGKGTCCCEISSPLLPIPHSLIGHFRVLFYLCFKTSLSAKPFIWKWVLQAISFSCKSVIFIRMVSHLDSLWNRGTRELENGLLEFRFVILVTFYCL